MFLSDPPLYEDERKAAQQAVAADRAIAPHIGGHTRFVVSWLAKVTFTHPRGG